MTFKTHILLNICNKKNFTTSRSGCEPREAAANLAKRLRTSRSGGEPGEAAVHNGGLSKQLKAPYDFRCTTYDF